MTGALIELDGSRAESVMPYHGHAPAELRLVADRVVDARAALAQLNDFIFDVRDQLTAAWTGAAATAAATELDTLRDVAAGAVERLDNARTALIHCSDDLEDTRSAIDGLRAEWRIYHDRLNAIAMEAALAWDTAPNATPSDRAADTRRYEHLQENLLHQWAEQAARADQASSGCGALLEASLGPRFGFVGGRGVVPTGLNAVLGVDALRADDAFMGAAADLGDPVDGHADAAAQWLLLSPTVQQFFVASAGGFPPPAAIGPRLVNASWRTLSPLQRQALIVSRPDAIGATDGVPAAARDQANRLTLKALETSLRAQIAAASVPVFPSWAPIISSLGTPPLTALDQRTRIQIENLNGRLANVRALRTTLDTDAGPPRYLLAMDVGGRGRAVVAVGNPDTATNVATYVPGVGSDVAGLPGDVRRVAALQQAATAAGSPATAVIAWLDYGAPPSLPAGAFDSFADAAAPKLTDFLEGLRATHDGPPAHSTLVPFSYGGLVVATASNLQPLAADQIVMVSSAGTELTSAGQFRLDGVPPDQVPGRIYATIGSGDFIPFTRLVHAGIPTAEGFGATGLPEVSAPNVLDSVDSPFVVRSSVFDAYVAHTAILDPNSPLVPTLGRLIAGES